MRERAQGEMVCSVSSDGYVFILFLYFFCFLLLYLTSLITVVAAEFASVSIFGSTAIVIPNRTESLLAVGTSNSLI
jgi:hypothetical protein